MTGKPPRKIVSGPSKKPDIDINGSRRTLDSEIAMPSLPNVSRPGLATVRPEPAIVDTVALEQAISVTPMNSITDEVIQAVAGEALSAFRVPVPTDLTNIDSRGVWRFKQREYVAIAEGYFVRVVIDPDSGLFRVASSRELKPSGPLLVPDGEGRFWDPLNSDRVPLPDSISFQTATLFRRMGLSVARFSNTTVARMLAVSGVNESVLRDVLIHNRPAPFLLEDTLRRFELDQYIKAEGRRVHVDGFTRFKELEAAFEADCDENTLQMRRVFPNLPKTAAQALWRNTSAAERLHMHHQPGLPQTVAKEALVALQEVRITRAGEGLYLQSVSNPDSDRLVLHMLGELAGWPQQTRIEIRQGAIDGDVLIAIGDALSPDRHILIRQDTGYTVSSSGVPSLNGSQDLYSTVWSLLLPVQRQALGITEGGGLELQRVIRAQPLPSRQLVSEVLHLPVLSPGVTADPVQNRHTGLLRGGADENPTSRRSLEDRIRGLYPEMTDDDVAAFISERLRHDPSVVLNRLEREFAALCQELETWRVDVPPTPAKGIEWSVEALADQLQLRQRFSENLQAIWQQKMMSGAGEDSFSSFIDFAAELPLLSARFEHVTELVLEARNPGVQLGKFLDSFPNLNYLVLVKVRMDGFAPGIFQMRGLQHLILKDCSLRLSETDAEGLSRIETLTLLRLDGNPLGVVPHVGFMRQMKELSLVNVGLTQIPSGVEQLGHLRLLDLHDNDIVDVGADLFEIPDTQSVYVNLIENPLSQAALLRIDEYLENASMDKEIVIRTQEPVLDVVVELSDFSDSGAESDSD